MSWTAFAATDGATGPGQAAGGTVSGAVPSGATVTLQNAAQPTVAAQGAVLYDATHNQFLFSKNADTQYYPASITKLMTALLKAISLLADNPYMGAALAEKFEIATDVRYFVVSKQLIFYRVDEGNSVIEILRVLDGRTDYLSVLFG